jgi:cytochrome d ubiquinol oxidase subunit II
VAVVLLCAAQGAIFLSLRTRGDLRERAHRLARPLTWAVVAGGAVFIAWTLGRSAGDDDLNAFAAVGGVGTAIAVIVAAVMLMRRRDGIAFAAMGTGVGLLVVMIFGSLWPNVMNSSGAPELALTISAAASTDYTLTVMTVVALVLTPVVLLYQGWTYWVFRHRVGEGTGDVKTPLDLLPGPGSEGKA